MTILKYLHIKRNKGIDLLNNKDVKYFEKLYKKPN